MRHPAASARARTSASCPNPNSTTSRPSGASRSRAAASRSRMASRPSASGKERRAGLVGDNLGRSRPASADGTYGGFETTMSARMSNPSSRLHSTNAMRRATPCRVRVPHRHGQRAVGDVRGPHPRVRALQCERHREASASGADIHDRPGGRPRSHFVQHLFHDAPRSRDGAPARLASPRTRVPRTHGFRRCRPSARGGHVGRGAAENGD